MSEAPTLFESLKGKAKRAVMPLIIGVLAGLTTSYAQNGHLYLIPSGSYQDLAAILLGAVGVIVAVFGAVLAVAALWGFSQMKQEAVRVATKDGVSAATNAALDHLKVEIADGDLRSYILVEIERLMQDELASPRMAKRFQDAADRLAFSGNEEDRFLNGNLEEEDQ